MSRLTRIFSLGRVGTLALLFIAAPVSGQASPLEVSEPVYSANSVAAGEAIEVRFQATSTQKSEVRTIARATLVDSSGRPIGLVEAGGERRVRLVKDRPRVLEYKLRVPAGAASDSYAICLDLLPAKPGEAAYMSSAEIAQGRRPPQFVVTGGSTGGVGTDWMLLPELPDLAVESVKIKDGQVRWNSPASLEIAVKNRGRGPTGPFLVAAVIEGRAVPAAVVTSAGLDPDKDAQIAFEVPIDTAVIAPGFHKLTVVIDRNAEFDDLDRENNSSALSFELLPAPPDLIIDKDEVILSAMAGSKSAVAGGVLGWNGTGGNFDVVAEPSEAWLSVSPGAASLGSDPKAFKIIAEPRTMAPGKYEGKIKFRSAGGSSEAGDDREVKITLEIDADTPPPSIRVLSPLARKLPRQKWELIIPYVTTGISNKAILVIEASTDRGNFLGKPIEEIPNTGRWQGVLGEEFHDRDLVFRVALKSDPKVSDVTKIPVTIVRDRIRLVEPSGQLTWEPGMEQVIRWEYGGNVRDVRCEYRVKGEREWGLIDVIPAAIRELRWKVPEELDGVEFEVRVLSYDDFEIFDKSTATILVEAPQPTLRNSADPLITDALIEPLGNQSGLRSRLAVRNGGLRASGWTKVEVTLNGKRDDAYRLSVAPVPPGGAENIDFVFPLSVLKNGENVFKITISADFREAEKARPSRKAEKPSKWDFDESNNEKTIAYVWEVAGDTGEEKGTADEADISEHPIDPKPSLLLSSFDLEPSEPRVGDLVTLRAVVRNDGTSDISHAYIEFFNDGRIIADVGAPTDEKPLKAGEARLEEKTVKFSEAGFRDFKAVAVAPGLTGAPGIGESGDSGLVKMIKVEVTANFEAGIRGALEEMAKAYSNGDLNRYLSFFAEDFQIVNKLGKHDIGGYRARLDESRKFAAEVALDVLIKSIERGKNNRAVVTYAVTEKSTWNGWDLPIEFRFDVVDEFVFENGKWLCKKREY